MHDLMLPRSSGAARILPLLAAAIASGCAGNDNAPDPTPQAVRGGQSGGAAGQSGAAGGSAPIGPMPGLGMMMAGTGGTAGQGAAGADGRSGSGGSSGQAGVGAAGAAGSQAGTGGSAGAGMSGSGGAGGSAGTGGGAPSSGMDPTAVCMGGTVGMDSDSATTRGLPSGRNLAIMMFQAPPPNKIVNFKTTLLVPKTPAQRSTLFIWPGLQHRGGSDPARIGNGVLQPVLTWGPSCIPEQPRDPYASWWISGMYVNISTGAAGPTGCAGGDPLQPAVGDRLYIEFAVSGTAWTQTITNLSDMKTVDFTHDLKGQDQNLAIWDIEVPTSARPAEDTIFEKSVLTFSDPITSCQPTTAAEVDYFSAPVRSPDGKSCCYDKIILKRMRN